MPPWSYAVEEKGVRCYCRLGDPGPLLVRSLLSLYRCCLDDVVVLDVLAFFWRRQRPLDAVARLRRLLTTPGSYHRGGGGGVPRSELSVGSCSKADPSLVAVVLGFVVTRLAQVGPRRACSRRCSSCPVTEGCDGIGVKAC